MRESLLRFADVRALLWTIAGVTLIVGLKLTMATMEPKPATLWCGSPQGGRYVVAEGFNHEVDSEGLMLRWKGARDRPYYSLATLPRDFECKPLEEWVRS